MFSMIFSRQQDWHPETKAIECQHGTKVSFFPWMTKIGQVTSLLFSSLLKAYFKSALAHPPQRSFATFFKEINGLSRMQQQTEYFWVTVRPTAHPMDLPNIMIQSAANLLACRNLIVLSASASILEGVVSPLQRLYPRYSIAMMGYCSSKLTIFKNQQAVVMSSPLAWKNSMSLLRLPGMNRQGMYQSLFTQTVRSKFPSRLVQLVIFLSELDEKESLRCLMGLSWWSESH